MSSLHYTSGGYKITDGQAAEAIKFKHTKHQAHNYTGITGTF